MLGVDPAAKTPTIDSPLASAGFAAWPAAALISLAYLPHTIAGKDGLCYDSKNGTGYVFIHPYAEKGQTHGERERGKLPEAGPDLQ